MAEFERGLLEKRERANGDAEKHRRRRDDLNEKTREWVEKRRVVLACRTDRAKSGDSGYLPPVGLVRRFVRRHSSKTTCSKVCTNPLTPQGKAIYWKFHLER